MIYKKIVEQAPEWNEFLIKIGSELNLEIYGNTYGDRPSLAGTCILEKNYYDSVLHIKTLVFLISILGPYFEIFGID